MIFFFFSSRRRHTRSKRDWSSDVCSSDLDRQIVVDRPDRIGRRKILEVHAKGKPIAPEIDLDTLAAGTPGFTGADLANLVNEAALLAARRGKKTIEQEELEEGIMRVIAGPEKRTRLLSEEERKITAYHEL